MTDYSQPTSCKCWAAASAQSPLAPSTIERRAAGPQDVVIAIRYAGICHSDIHSARGEWAHATFPMVPGHEIGGQVVAVGAEVIKFKVGDVVGVGCMVDSCRSCRLCSRGEEQYCRTSPVYTYGSTYKYPHCAEFYTQPGGNPTYGGYSEHIVVTEGFVCHIPTNLDLAAATPLLCAGITTYSPMARFGIKPGHKIAVVGLGGLGHMGVKFGVAWGAHVTVISRGTAKRDSALNDLKAHAFLDSTNAEEMKAAASTFDFILDTVSANHDIMALVNLLDVDGMLVLVGAPPENFAMHCFPLLMGRRSISGSGIGGIAETQQMLDFCGQHNITCDIELIEAARINEAYDRTVKSDVKYRFVIDAATL